MRYAISYVSTASNILTERQIEETLTETRLQNNQHEITGILLYSEGNFFQVLEGEKDRLKELYQKIKEDERHYDIIPIFQKEVHQTQFDSYITDFISLDSKYQAEDINIYLAQIEYLNPSIRSSVRYILNKFSEGFK